MSASLFVDTNILVYIYSKEELPKSTASLDALESADWDFVVSVQCLNELAATMLRKHQRSITQVDDIINHLMTTVHVAPLTTLTVRAAVALALEFQFSYWDSLIIASALENGCTTLLTEDLHHGQVIRDQLTIHNPFREMKV